MLGYLKDLFGGGIGSAISSPSRGGLYDTSFSDSGMDGGITGGGGLFGGMNNFAKGQSRVIHIKVIHTV